MRISTNSTSASSVTRFEYFTDPCYYVDDVYLDDTTGEAAPARPPAYQFLAVTPNGNGANLRHDRLRRQPTDNYALVDETPHNSDTDYVAAAAAGLKDTYALTTVTPPAGTAICCRHPLCLRPQTRHRRCPTTDRIALRHDRSARHGQALTTGYPMYQGDRVTLDPNTGLAWTQAGIDALEAGVQSAGTYA